MTMTTSSAQPSALFHYAHAAETIDSHLDNEARLLGAALERFVATCAEYDIGVGPELSIELRTYARRCGSTDEWVRVVAIAFQVADRGGMVSALLAMVLGRLQPELPGQITIPSFPHTVPEQPARPSYPGGIDPFAPPPPLPIDLPSLDSKVVSKVANTLEHIVTLLERGEFKGTLGAIVEDLEGPAVLLKTATDIWSDWHSGAYGGDKVKVVGVNGLNAVVNFALGKAGPVGLVITAVNAAEQLSGNFEASGLRLLTKMNGANDETNQLLLKDADRLQEATEDADLEHITKALSETLYEGQCAPFVRAYRETSDLMRGKGNIYSWRDAIISSTATMIAGPAGPVVGVLTSDEGRRSALNTFKEVARVADGFNDANLLRMSSFVDASIAGASGMVNRLPVPDGFKEQVNRTANTLIESSQRAADKVVDFFHIG